MSAASPEPIGVLLLGSYLHQRIEKELGREFACSRLWQHDRHAAFLAQHGGAFRALVTHSNAIPADRSMLSALPNLEVIATIGSGFDGIDVAAASERGIAIRTGAGANAEDVAELAFGLMLAVGRRIVDSDAHVRAGRWPEGRALTHRVSGSPLGIVGMGHIGRAVARRASAFDMPVLYTSRSARTDLPYRFVADLRELARNVRFLVLALPGGDDTRGLVNDAVLSALGRDGILVNVSRGSIVDEEALHAALTAGTLGGAGLDVFSDEPNVPRRLVGAPNLVLQAHHAALTHEAAARVCARAVANLRDHFGMPTP